MVRGLDVVVEEMVEGAVDDGGGRNEEAGGGREVVDFEGLKKFDTIMVSILLLKEFFSLSCRALVEEGGSHVGPRSHGQERKNLLKSLILS